MMNQCPPLLSIIVPSYNPQKFLPQLLGSIMMQSLQDLEVIIVDDASTESYQEIIDAYNNRGMNIKLINNPTNVGTKNSRLIGVTHAKGQIIAFADADDRLYGTRNLEHHVRLMYEKGADLMHFNILRHNITTGEQYVDIWDSPFAPTLSERDIFFTYTVLDSRAHGMWNKLYSRELCLKNIDSCHSVKIHCAWEDYFLTTWYLFHAQHYIGSEYIGYVYMHDQNVKVYKRASARIISGYIMLRDMLPLFKQYGGSDEALNQCKISIIQNMLWLFSCMCIKCYTDAAFNKKYFEELIDGSSRTDLYTALQYLLFEIQGSSKQLQTVYRLKDALANLV